MDDVHRFGRVYTPQSTHQKNKKDVFGTHFSNIRVDYFVKFGLKWVAVARIGLKLGGNEATRFRIILKQTFIPQTALSLEGFLLSL